MLPPITRAASTTYRPVGVVRPLLEPRFPRRLQLCPYLLPRLRHLSNHARQFPLEAGLITGLARAYANLATSVCNILRAILLLGSVVAIRLPAVAVQLMFRGLSVTRISLGGRFIGNRASGVNLVEFLSTCYVEKSNIVLSWISEIL